MADKRSYYAIIPANVRYDKSLSANAKLLYGEITALCNDKGYCWATNKYFADLYGVSDRSIRQWISVLEKRGYIKTETTYNEDGSKRYITISKYAPASSPPEENFLPPGRNLPTPPEENFHHNNTGTNTTVINKSVSQSKEKETKAEKKIDRQTDEIRNKLKKQIDYGYFEDNFPEDVTGVDVLIDCVAEMLTSPYTKINGRAQLRSVLKPYIDKADSESVRGFLGHMRGKKMRDVKNIGAYWQSAFINYLREEELTKLTI
jgi:DNA-binding transcriptional ArsR family regulator